MTLNKGQFDRINLNFSCLGYCQTAMREMLVRICDPDRICDLDKICDLDRICDLARICDLVRICELDRICDLGRICDIDRICDLGSKALFIEVLMCVYIV